MTYPSPEYIADLNARIALRQKIHALEQKRETLGLAIEGGRLRTKAVIAYRLEGRTR